MPRHDHVFREAVSREVRADGAPECRSRFCFTRPGDASTTCCSWEDVGDRDLAHRGAVDHDRYILSGSVDLAGAIPLGRRARIDFDLAVDQVNDPVDGDAAAGVRGKLVRLIE